MKTQRLVSLDLELNTKLKAEKNASELINGLLLAHYDAQKILEEVKPEGLDEIDEYLSKRLRYKHNKLSIIANCCDTYKIKQTEVLERIKKLELEQI